MQTVEVVLQVTVQVDVDVADKQSAIEHVWDEWHNLKEQFSDVWLDWPGLVRSAGKLELITVDGVEETEDA